MRLPFSALWLSILIGVCTPAFSEPRIDRHKVTTKLWVGGDDGLTQRFAVTLQSAIEDSSDLSVEPTAGGERLVLTIPTHLYSKQAQGRTNFQYVVIFTDHNSKYLGVSIGPCWEDSMKRCADRVLSKARLAWAERRRPN